MPITHTVKLVKLLIAEDDLEDVRITMPAFVDPPGWEVRVVHNGAEALEVLGIWGGDDGWRPNLIILDLHMPKLTGMEALKKIKQHSDLAPIPVVMWSISTNPDDIALAYKLGVAAYFCKPADSQEFLAVARAIRKFYDHARLYSLPNKH